MKESLRQLGQRVVPYTRALLVTLGWGTSFGGITLWAIFQGLLLPTFRGVPPPSFLPTETLLLLYYLAVFGVSILSGMIMADFGRTLGGFIVSYLVGGVIIFESLSAPGLSESTLNGLMLITREGLNMVAIDLTFRVLFPIPLFVLLIGAIVGAALGEHYS